MARATQKTGSTNLHTNTYHEESNRPGTSGTVNTGMYFNRKATDTGPGVTLDPLSSNGDIISSTNNYNQNATQPITLRRLNSPETATGSKSGAVVWPKTMKQSRGGMPTNFNLNHLPANNRKRKQA